MNEMTTFQNFGAFGVAAPTTAFTVDTPASAPKHPAIKYKTPIFTREDPNGEAVRMGIDSIDVIILGAQPNGEVTRSYYANPNPKEGERPTCSSSNGIRPSSYAQVPQSTECKGCRWAARGTAQDGKSVACGTKQRIAVVVVRPNDPNLEVHGMYISSTSLFGESGTEALGKYNFIAYLKYLGAHNYKAPMVVTRIEANPTKGANLNSVTFSAIGVLNQAQVNALQTEENIKAVKELTEANDQGPAAQPATQPAAQSAGNTAAATLAALGIAVPPGVNADALLAAVMNSGRGGAMAQTVPAQTAPVQTAPVQTAPVQPAPVQPAPVQTAPVDAGALFGGLNANNLAESKGSWG